MSSIITAAVIVAGATVYSAQKNADAQKKAAQRQASAIKSAERATAARNVIGNSAKKNVTKNADVLLGTPSSRATKQRRSRIDLQSNTSNQTSAASSIGGL